MTARAFGGGEFLHQLRRAAEIARFDDQIAARIAALDRRQRVNDGPVRAFAVDARPHNRRPAQQRLRRQRIARVARRLS